MSTYNTITQTNTYTVTDIRKTFEGFDADLRMIARRTGKWTQEYVEKIVYDILKLAESKYISKISIVLENNMGRAIRAAKYNVNEQGKAQSSERPGENDWLNLLDTKLVIVVEHNASWHALTTEGQATFMTNNNFKIGWVKSNVDTSFSHLSKQGGQLYGSNGYELKKENYK